MNPEGGDSLGLCVLFVFALRRSHQMVFINNLEVQRAGLEAFSLRQRVDIGMESHLAVPECSSCSQPRSGCVSVGLSGRHVVVVPAVIWAGLDRALLSARERSLSAESLCSCSTALHLLITSSSYF